MCASYKAFGAKGLLTNGAGRDIDQVGQLGDFQLFTNGAICSHGYFHLSDMYVPVEIGGLVIYPDDLLQCLTNGIVQIPKEIASEVADLGGAFIESERLFLDVVNKPEVSLQQFKAPRVAVRWPLTGSHHGRGMLGRPAGAPVHIMGVTYSEFGPWGLRREYTIIDETAIWRQIALPTG